MMNKEADKSSGLTGDVIRKPENTLRHVMVSHDAAAVMQNLKMISALKPTGVADIP